MSNRCWMHGIVVSSLWIVAAMVPCSASFLRLLTGKGRQLGAVLGHLVEQKLALCADQGGVSIGGRRRAGHRIISAGQAARSRAMFNCSARRSLCELDSFRRVHRRIKLNQHVAGLNRLPVLRRMERTTPVSNG